MIYTTLKAIKEHRPCAYGWKKLLRHLGKTMCDEEPLPLVEILKSNGLDDAIWCLRTVDHKNVRLFAVACAREVQHLMTDAGSLKALDVVEAYANGQATEEELEHARSAANAAHADTYADAARTAAYAVRAAYTSYADTYADAARAAADAAARAYAADAAAYAAAYAAYAAYAYAAKADAAKRQVELFIQFFGG